MRLGKINMYVAHHQSSYHKREILAILNWISTETDRDPQSSRFTVFLVHV